MQEYERAVKSIVRSEGGYREKEILKRGYTIKESETWNKYHKVLYVCSTEVGIDRYRDGFAVDLVTRSIVG